MCSVCHALLLILRPKYKYDRMKNLFGAFCALAIVVVALSSCGDKSMKMNNPRNIKGVVSYKRSFGDLNAVQLKSAKAIGISPVASREEAESLKKKLVEGNGVCAQMLINEGILVVGESRAAEVFSLV